MGQSFCQTSGAGIRVSGSFLALKATVCTYVERQVAPHEQAVYCSAPRRNGMDQDAGGKCVAKNETVTPAIFLTILVLILLCRGPLWAQTDCEAGNGPLDSAEPKTISSQQVIQKLGAAEAAAKNARLRYTYTQDVLMQTLVGTN